MKIGIDLDNVLNNLNEEWINTYNEYNNDNLTIDDIKSWDIHKYTKNGEQIYKYLDANLFSCLKPLPYSIEITKELQKHYELFVVTASHPKNIAIKMDWLNQYFPHISYDNVIICQRKDLVNVDLLIDDAPHNILHFPRHVLVMDYAWNRDLGNKFPRAKNWKGVYEYLMFGREFKINEK